MKQTKVLFIYEGQTNEVLAVFPEHFRKSGNDIWFDCFAFIGGHSVCSANYLKINRLAEITDILPVYDYLKSLGYNLQTLYSKPKLG